MIQLLIKNNLLNDVLTFQCWMIEKLFQNTSTNPWKCCFIRSFPPPDHPTKGGGKTKQQQKKTGLYARGLCFLSAYNYSKLVVVVVAVIVANARKPPPFWRFLFAVPRWRYLFARAFLSLALTELSGQHLGHACSLSLGVRRFRLFENVSVLRFWLVNLFLSKYYCEFHKFQTDDS